MNELGLIILGEKGYNVLETLFSKYPKFLKTVIIGSDIGVKDDFSRRSHIFCKKNKLSFELTNNANSHLSTVDGYWIVIGWRWLLPVSDKIIIIHDSILPKYRGFSPLVNSLISGESKIGVSAIFISENYDEGEIIYQKEIKIDYPIKINKAISLISSLYVLIANKICKKLYFGQKLNSIKQSGKITYSLWRNEEDYFIKWDKLSASKIKRFVDAVGYPYGGAKSFLNGEVCNIIEVEEIQDVHVENREMSIGKVMIMIENFPVIVCKSGLIKILEAYDKNGDNLLPLKKFRSKFT